MKRTARNSWCSGRPRRPSMIPTIASLAVSRRARRHWSFCRRTGDSTLSFRKPPTGPRKARPHDRLRGCPESIFPVVVMDSGLARSLPSGGAERRPVGGPGMTGSGRSRAPQHKRRGGLPRRARSGASIGVRRKKFSPNKPARKTKLLSRFNKSTRRANHPKTLSSPSCKNISLSPSGKSLI